MRQVLALLLLFAISLGLTAPLLAAPSQDPASEKNLPACCRRDGKHRCHMREDSAETGHTGPALEAMRSKCSQYPSSPAAPSLVQLSTAPASKADSTAIVAFSATIEETETQYRISCLRTRQKRGPPAAA